MCQMWTIATPKMPCSTVWEALARPVLAMNCQIWPSQEPTTDVTDTKDGRFGTIEDSIFKIQLLSRWTRNVWHKTITIISQHKSRDILAKYLIIHDKCCDIQPHALKRCTYICSPLCIQQHRNPSFALAKCNQQHIKQLYYSQHVLYKIKDAFVDYVIAMSFFICIIIVNNIHYAICGVLIIVRYTYYIIVSKYCPRKRK